MLRISIYLLCIYILESYLRQYGHIARLNIDATDIESTDIKTL